MTLPVWMYWEGESPEWIKACQRTVEAHATDVRLIDADDFDRMRDIDRDIDLSRLCTAHRADFIRAFLLARHGGLWVDSDCIVLRPLQPIFDALTRYDFLGYKERQGHIANNFMGAPAGSRHAAAYYARVCEILRSGKRLEWLSLGSYALTETIQKSGVPWYRVGYDLIQPVCWSNPAAFFTGGDDDEHKRYFNERAFCYMLSNNMIQGYQSAHPEQPLTGETTFFSYLLRRAFGSTNGSRQRARYPMGTSNWQQIPFCIEAMMDVSPMRVLDVGIGFGRWGMLVREFCEEWKGRTHRENWQVHLEGIEIFPKNVEEYHHLFYDWVHVGDAAPLVEGMSGGWHLVILGDVLQLWPKTDAERVLNRSLEISDYVLVNAPIGDGWKRSGMYGNPHEEHQSFWQLADFLAARPVRHNVYKEYNGRDYGTFLLSRTDPRGLRRLSPMENLFTNIYRNNLWLDAESVSGPGSRLSETARISQQLPSLLAGLNARRLLDAPCGDFNWMRHVELGIDEYIGGDIVRDLIVSHQQNFGNPHRRFIPLDVTADELPRDVDVILCRDCLVHLSYRDAFRALKNFQKSGAQYLLTTTYTEREVNVDIDTGGWRPLDLRLPPFNFPAPLALINENCSEGNGCLADKCLGLWRIADLPLESTEETKEMMHAES